MRCPHFSRLRLLGSAVLMTVGIDGSYTRHIQQSHDLSSSDIGPCELTPRFLIGEPCDGETVSPPIVKEQLPYVLR